MIYTLNSYAKINDIEYQYITVTMKNIPKIVVPDGVPEYEYNIRLYDWHCKLSLLNNISSTNLKFNSLIEFNNNNTSSVENTATIMLSVKNKYVNSYTQFVVTATYDNCIEVITQKISELMASQEYYITNINVIL